MLKSGIINFNLTSYILLVTLFSASVQVLHCQKVNITTTKYKIGDKIDLMIEPNQSGNSDTETIIINTDSILCENYQKWKSLNADSIGDFEILDMDTSKCKLLRNKLMIKPGFKERTNISLGVYSIGQFKLTNEITISVMPSDSMLSGQKNDILDIKPIIVHKEFPWKMILITVLFLLVICFGLYKIYKAYMDKPLENQLLTVESKTLIEDELITKLQKIKNEKAYINMEVKEFQSQLIDILKKYINHRYKISSFEMTTNEVFKYLKNEKLPNELYSNLNTTFNLSDLVKFAKAQPDEEIFDKVITDAIDFINQTRKS